MELTDVTEEQVQWAVDRLNHRPRKVQYLDLESRMRYSPDCR